MNFARIVTAPLVGSFLLAQTANAEEITYQPEVNMQVGETTILKGVRHRNCRDVPSWEKIATKLPKTPLGTYFDAGIGETFSKRCGLEMVPARAVGFRATQPGQHALTVFKDPITLTVTP